MRYLTDISWCYLMVVLCMLITRVVIATGPVDNFSGFYSYLSASQVRAAAIISAGVVGSP